MKACSDDAILISNCLKLHTAWECDGQEATDLDFSLKPSKFVAIYLTFLMVVIRIKLSSGHY